MNFTNDSPNRLLIVGQAIAVAVGTSCTSHCESSEREKAKQ